MCGIAGYIGKKEGLPIVFKNIRKLEYRGYDSAGAAFFNDNGDLTIVKAAGKLTNLEKALKGHRSKPLTAAIAHSRWATHGEPNEINAHPHADCSGMISLVHNGIIENYKDLKDDLVKKGHKFISQTDTEVIAHLMEDYGFKEAIRKIIGAYAIAVIFKDQPDKLYIARLGSPLVVGIGHGGHYVASDPTALAGAVKKVIYLKDGQSGVLTKNSIKLSPSKTKIENLDITPEQAKKGEFPHFMLKEIYESPEVVRAALRGRLLSQKGIVKLGGLEPVAKNLKNIRRFEIIACGTSYYAGLIGAQLFQELIGIPAQAILASEYRYRNDPVQKGTAAVFISQSGETADTLAALRKANERKYLTLGIVNVVGSSIARETVAGVYNHAGPEIGVASTKAFLSQLTILALMALRENKNKKIMRELSIVPDKIKLILQKNDEIKKLAEKYSAYQNFLYIGRGYNYPAALEGSLKLKEISYIHAEGYAGGEMKHGPIALIDENFPSVVIAPKNRVYEKIVSNIAEIKARRGPIIAVATEGDKKIKQMVDDVIYIPKTEEPLEPMLTIVPLQLFAYHVGVLRGCDVDKPRNLAKSVTVE